MKNSALIAVGSLVLVTACEPPPQAPIISDAKVSAIAGRCGVAPSTIKVKGDTVVFDPPRNIPYSKAGCVLRELRADLPYEPIGFTGNKKPASKGTE